MSTCMAATIADLTLWSLDSAGRVDGLLVKRPSATGLVRRPCVGGLAVRPCVVFADGVGSRWHREDRFRRKGTVEAEVERVADRADVHRAHVIRSPDKPRQGVRRGGSLLIGLPRAVLQA